MNTPSLWKTKAAEALYPALNHFHLIRDRRLRAVWHMRVESSIERIVLDFGEVSLVVAVDEDDDSIKVRAADTSGLDLKLGLDETQSEVWRNYIGHPFGWGWITVNQQGYCDGILLSFSGLNPQIVLNIAGSSIRVAGIAPL